MYSFENLEIIFLSLKIHCVFLNNSKVKINLELQSINLIIYDDYFS